MRREFTEGNAGNLESAHVRTATTCQLATVDEASWAGITGELRKRSVVAIRFQLGAELSVFVYGAALPLVTCFPCFFCHKGGKYYQGFHRVQEK